MAGTHVLNNGVAVPVIGTGVFQTPADEVAGVVETGPSCRTT